jgi:hypothetical protein
MGDSKNSEEDCMKKECFMSGATWQDTQYDD